MKDGFQHCVEKHKENVFLDANSCEMNLERVVNQRKIVKLKSDQVVVLHIIYGEKTGLSVFGEFFYNKYKEDSADYSLVVKSADGSSDFIIKNIKVMNDSHKQSKQFITNGLINSIGNPKIKFMFQIRVQQFDMTGEKTVVKKLNNYKLLRSNDAFYACCNAKYGCNFMGTLNELIKHEEACELLCCFVKDCNLICIQNNLVEHVVEKHGVCGTKIMISYNDLLKNNWYFLYNQCYLFLIHAKIDDACMCVITVNYTITNKMVQQTVSRDAQIPDIGMTASTFEVTVGSKLKYRQPLLILKDNFTINGKHSMYIPKSVIEENRSIEIKVCLHNPPSLPQDKLLNNQEIDVRTRRVIRRRQELYSQLRRSISPSDIVQHNNFPN